MQSYNITFLKYHLEPLCFIKKKVCSDTELKVQRWNRIISIFPRIQTVKNTLLSNKYIVHLIKNITSFKAICGYTACIIYVCLTVFSQSGIIVLRQILEKTWNLHVDIFLKPGVFFVKLNVTGAQVKK